MFGAHIGLYVLSFALKTDYLNNYALTYFIVSSCNSIYIGKTKRLFLVRAYEHLGLSVRTNKKCTFNPKNSNNTSVLNHINKSSSCRGDLKSKKEIKLKNREKTIKFKKNNKYQESKERLKKNKNKIK